MDEKVDILLPPTFEPTGEIKTRRQAYEEGDWIGTFNLWIVTRNPEPAIIYQQRSPQSTWAPNKLDVTAGGHLQAGEGPTGGLREVDEELGKQYRPDQLIDLGKKIFVGFNTDGTSHNNLVNIFMIEDNAALHSYKLDPAEVYAICVCPIKKLLKAHQDPNYSFRAHGVDAYGQTTSLKVHKDTFPENYWDNYHYKIAILADRYFKGENNLLY